MLNVSSDPDFLSPPSFILVESDRSFTLLMQKDVPVHSSVILYIFMLKFCTFSYLDTCKVCVPVRCLLCSIWSSDRWAAELRSHHILAEWCPKISLCQENKRHHFNQKEQIVLVILILCLLFIHYLLFPGTLSHPHTESWVLV